MKVKALCDFRDREQNLILREKDKVFDVNEERAGDLVRRGLVEIIKGPTGVEEKG